MYFITIKDEFGEIQNRFNLLYLHEEQLRIKRNMELSPTYRNADILRDMFEYDQRQKMFNEMLQQKNHLCKDY